MNLIIADIYADVKEFMLKHKRPLGLEAVDLNKITLFRMRLINEELAELSIAADTRNLEEFVDAICDLAYVVVGTSLTYAGQVRPVHFSDRQEDGAKVQIPPDDQLTDFLTVVTYQVGNVADSMNSGDSVGVHIGCRKILINLSTMAMAMSVPLGSAFAEVHRSNMSKASLDERGKGGKGPEFIKPDLKALLGIQG